jgi:NitT/TauT family transport system substrate-binding protein
MLNPRPWLQEVHMGTPRTDTWGRREFVGGLTLAGAMGLQGFQPWPVAADPPPETTTLRLAQTDATCTAPQFVAEELLRGEGFTEVK